MSAATEALGLIPNYDRRPGERYDIRPHGTVIAYDGLLLTLPANSKAIESSTVR